MNRSAAVGGCAMKCVEAKQMINRFVEKKLSWQELEQFLQHVEHCDDCMDELDIYYTMNKAFDLLDTGAHQNYNFREMLDNDLHAARRAVIMHRTSLILRDIFFAGLAILVLLGLYFLFMR